MALQVNDTIPSFTLLDAAGKEWTFPTDASHLTVLYFYPKDNTGGCTTEAKEFSSLLPEFSRLDAQVFGISPDSAASHQKFIDKQQLSVTLLSDPDKTVISAFGVWVTKKLYGREYMGVLRSTFVIDSTGKILAAWDKVKVKGHASEVLQALHPLV
ncbi:peroxiredoxin [Methanocorpusculum sp. GPch4]|uniref:peroxiredoxin n=1 Tax=Methanocorpusculum sp. GPch4 TaxID=2527877 RepID=UPI0014329F26|nr:peroxiredoxin [Methanocorpusculum sp. GPch4]NLC91532.1 peroxiredoxin [Methanocorpusculum parvum]